MGQSSQFLLATPAGNKAVPGGGEMILPHDVQMVVSVSWLVPQKAQVQAARVLFSPRHRPQFTHT
ncbi:MAG: hypothetical protein GX562_00410 [Coriobacteriaceae bacterium]|nr:hypothetical protein [Coriobacteriaceae bacterium]